MPSQEEYLDNLLKGIENSESLDNSENSENTEEMEEAKAPEMAEQDAPQIDMSDMDKLLQSALNAQKEDAPTDTASENAAIHPEETVYMSEDEIDRLLQQNREQAEEAPKQGTADANDDLIKMLESADEEGLSKLLDQVSPQPAQDTADEEAAEEQEKGRHGRKKKKEKKEKGEKKPGFFDRFKKKPKESVETQEDLPAMEESLSEAGVSEEAADMTIPSEPVEENPVPEATEPEQTGTSDDELDALLAGAFPEQPDSAEGISAEPESADVMDILKAAGADIVEESEQKKEKKGFFAKLLDLFTEEDEEEEESDQLQLSDENKKILEEMDGKNSKKKEKKQKKEKKPKKEKQPKKPKKEKPKKEAAPAVPEKKLSPKKIIPIVVVCISLGAVILILGNFLTEYMSKRSGREAYYAGDYQTCYQNLFGKELNETEQVMYSKSESILTIRMWLREYEVFVNEGSELEALDSLLQAVHDYPSLLDYATQWNAQDEVTSAFGEILNILSQKYQLSQDEAQAIADISDDVEYTKNVMMVLQKLGLGSWELPQTTQTETANPAQNTENVPEELPDPLPEEKEIQQ